MLMLGCSVLPLPAHAGWFGSDSTPAAKPDDKTAQPATNLEDSIRQAQMLRLAGQYPEAIKHLSQLMMLASDDGRVISEYGKTLAAMGRPTDAVNFLTRAQQLQPGDWTICSALGVAYDQLGDQKSAQRAYEQALSIKPEEPSVLNNYALSRMLAKDPDMARNLAQRAENAGGSGDVKIARTIAMIRSLAVPAPVVAQAPQAAPQISVARNQLPAPAAAPANAVSSAQQQTVHVAAPQAPAAEMHDNRVVMQRVPVDPLAGPVQSAKTAAPVATHAPNPLQPQAATVLTQTATAKPQPVQPSPKPVLANIVKADVDPAAKPVPGKSAAPVTAPMLKTAEASKPAAVAASKPLSPAPAKLAETKPVPAAQPALKTADASKPAVAVASKTTVTASVKTADGKSPVTVAAKVAVTAPAKMAETKPEAEASKPAVAVSLKMTPTPVKAVDAGKPAPAPKVLPPAPVKAVAKDGIPGLRMSANAF